MRTFIEKKWIFFIVLVFACVWQGFSAGSVEFGIGSGYVFYGDDDVRERNDQLSDSSQIILQVTAAYNLKIAEPVYLSFGIDTAFDAHWGDGHYVHMLDYAGLVGFKVYPGIAGLLLSVDYALGRRTDFFDLPGYDGSSYSTNWGNGFKFGIQYDFLYNSNGLSPVAGISWRRMPRGNSADNILSVFLKLTIK
ncbi:MAG: hypothetical protein IJP62_09305 [Treponema sp.]|nr:hypothetical protein [Treponema sp.]